MNVGGAGNALHGCAVVVAVVTEDVKATSNST